MWKPSVNFITLHYAYILSFGVLALIFLYPYGNLTAVDAYFFGVSSSTESGLNTIDVKALKTYQQLFLYFVPIVTNLGFVNLIVVVVRLRWFRSRFTQIKARRSWSFGKSEDIVLQHRPETDADENGHVMSLPKVIDNVPATDSQIKPSRISFAPDPKKNEGQDQVLHVPGPRECENGEPITSLSEDGNIDGIKPVPSILDSRPGIRLRNSDTRSLNKSTSIDGAVSAMFVLGGPKRRAELIAAEPADIASMSREELGGIEYRALCSLLPIAAGYFFGLHLLGVVCLIPWIHLADPKYRDYLDSQGQNKTWWAIYSSQTMVDNLGFTLTPDSMISFRDATWPMLVMSFIAFAGNTFYPCFLRLFIWTIYKLAPATSSLKESLRFLLDHPRRCYTLLFPSSVTWTLAGVLVVLNFIDVLLIVLLDLDNPEVNVLSPGPRILAAIFQAASSRHTGTATFNLMNVNPAVQFSLLVMMYISVYPIAISIRVSNSYEENAVGIYGAEENLEEKRGSKKYFLRHLRNQLSFDLWYVFLGVFCITAAESKRIMDREDYAFSVFSVFFEVVSAYGNVGLSLGHPTNSTSLSGHFTTFSKLIVCAMMIRGRHRGMPYALDRAITLPIDRLADYPREGREENSKTDGIALGNRASSMTEKRAAVEEEGK